MNNERAKALAAILKSAGLKFKDVTCLGVFIHVDCYCMDSARAVGNLLTQAGYQLLKLTSTHDKQPGYGGKCVPRFVCHSKFPAA